VSDTYNKQKIYMMIALLLVLNLGYVLPNTIFYCDWSHEYGIFIIRKIGVYMSRSETPRPFTLCLPGFGSAEDTVILPEFAFSPKLTPFLEVQCRHR
jgi:hypothetical protein